jgi:hypothetical protein
MTTHRSRTSCLADLWLPRSYTLNAPVRRHALLPWRSELRSSLGHRSAGRVDCVPLGPWVLAIIWTTITLRALADRRGLPTMAVPFMILGCFGKATSRFARNQVPIFAKIHKCATSSPHKKFTTEPVPEYRPSIERRTFRSRSNRRLPRLLAVWYTLSDINPHRWPEWR